MTAPDAKPHLITDEPDSLMGKAMRAAMDAEQETEQQNGPPPPNELEVDPVEHMMSQAVKIDFRMDGEVRVETNAATPAETDRLRNSHFILVRFAGRATFQRVRRDRMVRRFKEDKSNPGHL